MNTIQAQTPLESMSVKTTSAIHPMKMPLESTIMKSTIMKTTPSAINPNENSPRENEREDERHQPK